MVKYLKNFTAKAFREFRGEEPEQEPDEQPAADSYQTEFSAPASDVVPVGTAEEVLEWVGDDEERARRALEAEESRSRPRKTVTSALEEIVNGGN